MKKIFIPLLAAFTLSAFSQTISVPLELINVVDGKTVSINACAGCKGVVVIFTSLDCPYDQHYQDRIKKLTEKYSSDISFYLINSNPGTDEADAKMKVAYSKWNLSIPYLSDKKQIAMTALTAKKTPEAFLLKPSGSGLQIIYRGAIDDNPQIHHDTGNDFLDQALGELVSDKPIKIPEERVIGCTIRKE